MVMSDGEEGSARVEEVIGPEWMSCHMSWVR